jgi:hypothetical protein
MTNAEFKKFLGAVGKLWKQGVCWLVSDKQISK